MRGLLVMCCQKRLTFSLNTYFLLISECISNTQKEILTVSLVAASQNSPLESCTAEVALHIGGSLDSPLYLLKDGNRLLWDYADFLIDVPAEMSKSIISYDSDCYLRHVLMSQIRVRCDALYVRLTQVRIRPV